MTFSPNAQQVEEEPQSEYKGDHDILEARRNEQRPNIKELKKQNPCYICGETGHWANECKQKKKRTENSRRRV